MDNTEKVECPYCGTDIENNTEQCCKCGEFFVEPHIKNIKLTSIGQFIVFTILSFGFYPVIWTLLNYKAFVDIASEKDIIKLRNILIITILSVYVFVIIPVLFPLAAKICALFMSYRMLRILEKYSLEKYNSPVTHSETGWFFFDILYVVYFIDTYKQRVYDPGLRNHMECRGWLKYLLIIALAALLLWAVYFIWGLVLVMSI